MNYDVQVRITPRPGILDPEGETIARALVSLGFEGVGDVRSGRLLTLRLEAEDPGTARTAAADMCERLIANPIIEDYAIEVTEANGLERDGAERGGAPVDGARGPLRRGS